MPGVLKTERQEHCRTGAGNFLCSWSRDMGKFLQGPCVSEHPYDAVGPSPLSYRHRAAATAARQRPGGGCCADGTQHTSQNCKGLQ